MRNRVPEGRPGKPESTGDPQMNVFGRRYTVVEGDTLSAIAQRFYGDTSWFTTLAEANGITNPNLISPGLVLDILDLPDHTEPFQTTGSFRDKTFDTALEEGIPAGRLLVIESVSGYYQTQKGFLGPIVLSDGGEKELQVFPWVQSETNPDAGRFYAFAHSTRLYIRGQSVIGITALGSDAILENSLFTVSGYLTAKHPWMFDSAEF
jgi:LysM domain